MALHPRYRGTCADFFVTPDQTERLVFDGPADAIRDIEHAAARAGRTWNDQFTYVMEVGRGYHLPDFDDGRTAEDWRTLLSRCRVRVTEAGDWVPCACLWRRTP